MLEITVQNLKRHCAIYKVGEGDKTVIQNA